MNRRRWVVRGLAAAVVTAAATLVVAPPGEAGPLRAPGGGGAWVTLLTGDRVLVGGANDVRIEPAPRVRLAQFQQFTRRGDRYVVPSDAGMLVQAGKLDLELFNVTGLVRQGYDDARVTTLPLLVRYADRAAGRAVPGGAAVRRALPGVRMAALDAEKSAATRVLDDLTEAGAGVEKVWLNAKATATLDGSVSGIGAPAAWSTGLTGKGVTVAVLDTGVDTDHADLAGKVASSKDFSGKGSVEDGNGHGTHVASTVAGTGAASGGRYKGVAPDVTLAVGKVLDDDGYGAFDAIIAGMQWAASDVNADVVNMSLGADPSDGTDPVSAAVDTLTHQYGTLFVVAAGNDGMDEWVSSPAAASAALAVGSVSKSDVSSPFSNRGPRPGDGAVKPEIVAPGEGIVAAAPAGVPPLGEPVASAYQRLDGTSMAAPHVAGSAALLAQRHPTWSAAELKDGLVSTATEVVAAGVYAVGAGRVDAGRAATVPVTATGTVSTFLTWPNQGTTQKRTVTWRNTGTAPVTLGLTAVLTRRDGAPAPAGMLTLTAGTVTVPAGGRSTVDLDVSAVDGAAGTYGGVLVARDAAGTVATRTALSVRQEEPMYDLTVALVDRDGRIPSEASFPSVAIVNLDDSGVGYRGPPGKVRLPAGRYAVHTTIETPRAGQEASYSFISHPELRLDRDIAQTLDARAGKPVSITVDNPTARGGASMIQVMSRISDCDCVNSWLSGVDPRFQAAYAATVPGTSSSTYAFGHARRAVQPAVELFADDGHRFEVGVGWLSGSPTREEQATLSMVHGGQATPDDLAKIDATGRLVLFEVPDTTSYEEVVRRVENIRAVGGRMAMVSVMVGDDASTRPWTRVAAQTVSLPTLQTGGETGARLVALVKAGATTVQYASHPLSAHRYELAYGVQGKVNTDQVYRPRTHDLAAVSTAYHDNRTGSVPTVAGSVEFFGTQLGGGWSVPVKAAQERVEYFTPGTWRVYSFFPGSNMSRDTLVLAAGRSHRIAWNKAVAGPTFTGLTNTFEESNRPWARRVGGAIDVILPMFGDAAGRPRVPYPPDGTDTGAISLYRDGTLVATTPVPDRGRFEVPDGAGTYRLVAEANRTADWWPLWTNVSAAWTFRSSSADDGKALPLLTARFDPPVDFNNRAPGGRSFTIPVHVARQGADAVTVTSLGVDVSYDDGKTWTKATVKRSSGNWSVTVAHPAGGYAAFRTTVVDSDGNRLEQTVLRAYQIA